MAFLSMDTSQLSFYFISLLPFSLVSVTCLFVHPSACSPFSFSALLSNCTPFPPLNLAIVLNLSLRFLLSQPSCLSHSRHSPFDFLNLYRGTMGIVSCRSPLITVALFIAAKMETAV